MEKSLNFTYATQTVKYNNIHNRNKVQILRIIYMLSNKDFLQSRLIINHDSKSVFPCGIPVTHTHCD